jgi:hypothetical protein
MIVLILAVTMGLVMALLFFCLKYTRMLGADQEQRTAIEAAALAAANDLSRIVVEDPQYGFVSLGDYAPVASNTKAPDGEALPVRSFNSLLATVRSEMIIANSLNDANMKALASLDYDNLMDTRDFLISQLQAACTGDTDYKDVDGNLIDLDGDVTQAYEANVIRMTGAPSSMDKSSLRITLGGVATPLPTWTPVPQPSSYTNVASGQMWYPTDPATGNQMTPCYMALVNQPYNGKDFVFSPVAQNIQLVDHKKFVTTVAGLPYMVPSIVKVECDQVYVDGAGRGGPAAAMDTHRVHAVACAEAGSNVDPRPAPGALKITFVDGAIGELGKPGDLLTNPQLTTNPIDLYSPDPGDFPGGTLNPINPPVLGPNPALSKAWGRSLLDWIRRAGPKANIGAVLNMQTTAFNTGGIAATAARMNVYEWNPDGTISYQVLSTDPLRKLAGSNRQGYGVGDSTFNSTVTGNTYDTLLTDTVNVSGRLSGGLHGGEPLNDASLTAANLVPPNTISMVDPTQDDTQKTSIAWTLVLAVPMVAGFFASRRNRRWQAVLVMGLIAMTSIEVLSACGGGGPPSRRRLRTPAVGARVPRATYVKNGLAVELEFRKH